MSGADTDTDTDTGSSRSGGTSVSCVPCPAAAFDVAVAPGGYAWWYVDALSDDGQHGITIIAFLGSVFSPYYAWARRRAPGGAADPLQHCAVNIALYGRGSHRWAMTERGARQVERDTRNLRIGPSALAWQGDSLKIDLNEIAVPWPGRIRGVVRVHPAHCHAHTEELSPQGAHRWSPIAPSARVEVELDAPGLLWSGPGYLDSNRGDAPLERAFSGWNWSRAHLAGGRSVVLYDVDRHGLPPRHIGLRFDTAAGSVTPVAPMPTVTLAKTRWRVPRVTRSDTGRPARVLQTLTDAPFYARSVVGAQWAGEPVTAVHESLSLARFDTAWVQAMLPFRMPRRAG